MRIGFTVGMKFIETLSRIDLRLNDNGLNSERRCNSTRHPSSEFKLGNIKISSLEKLNWFTCSALQTLHGSAHLYIRLMSLRNDHHESWKAPQLWTELGATCSIAFWHHCALNSETNEQGRILGIRCAQQSAERRRYGLTDGRTDGRTDISSYRDATAHLKTLGTVILSWWNSELETNDNRDIFYN